MLFRSSDSLMELKRIVELNENIHALNLIIGMHYFEHFTRVQYNAAMVLNDFLTCNQIGEVKLVNAFKYHGKLYSYSNDSGPYAGIIGSNNLSSILDTGARVYESSFYINEEKHAREMHDYPHHDAGIVSGPAFERTCTGLLREHGCLKKHLVERVIVLTPRATLYQIDRKSVV